MPSVAWLLVGPPLADRSKGRGQTKRGTLVLQVWGLSVGLTIRPWKKILVTKTNGVKTGLMEGRRLGETRKRNFCRKNEERGQDVETGK